MNFRFIDPEETAGHVSKAFVIIFCIFILFCVIVALCIYRRHAKREIKQQIDIQIKDSVNNYLALSQGPKDDGSSSRSSSGSKSTNYGMTEL